MRLVEHRSFLQDLLKKGDHHRRQQKLQTANSEQINAVSELILNGINGEYDVSTKARNLLKPHKDLLRDLKKRKLSIKKRREMLIHQSASGFWEGLNLVNNAIYRSLSNN